MGEVVASAPIINGDQGSLFLTNWPNYFNNSVAGNYTLDIPFTNLIPVSYGTPPNILITSVSIVLFANQGTNLGSARLNIEPTGPSLNWKFLCYMFDGELQKTEHYNPGVRMVPAQNLCFQASWSAYATGPDGYGGVGVNRQYNIQLCYKLEL